MPRLLVTPPGLVTKSSRAAMKLGILIISDEKPFRVLKVEGALLGAGLELPMMASSRHRLELPIQPTDSLEQGGKSEIIITTDHPDQALVSVSVLVLPSEKQKKGTE